MQGNLSQQILRVDVAGMPLDWINYQDAVRLYYANIVAYEAGTALFRILGGINAITGERSVIKVNSVIATYGKNPRLDLKYIPPLNSNALFKRDGFLCLYCGESFSRRYLSRDHVLPFKQGGKDNWNNVVTACKRCNNQKADRTPEQADMKLLAIPFVPTHAEYIYLRARTILVDQMEFLKAHFPRKSRLRDS